MSIRDFEIEVKEGIARWSSDDESGELDLGTEVTLEIEENPEEKRPATSKNGSKASAAAERLAAREQLKKGKKAKGKKKEEKVAEADPEQKEEPAPETESKEPKKESKKKESKKKTKGFSLCINCVPVGAKNVIILDDILEDLRKELEEELEVDSYYDVDAFVRRDAFSKVAPTIAERAAGKTLVALGVGTACSDLKSVVDALRGIAKDITIGAGA